MDKSITLCWVRFRAYFRPNLGFIFGQDLNLILICFWPAVGLVVLTASRPEIRSVLLPVIDQFLGIFGPLMGLDYEVFWPSSIGQCRSELGRQKQSMGRPVLDQQQVTTFGMVLASSGLLLGLVRKCVFPTS